MSDFNFTVYARRLSVGEFIRVAVSVDNKEWHELPFVVDLMEESSSRWRKYQVHGEVPDTVGAEYIRLSFLETALPSEAHQLGHILLRSKQQ